METKTIEAWIKINPKYIGSGLDSHVREEIKKQMKNECDEKTGHVIRILEVSKILDNRIQNSSSEMVILVNFTIEVFRPSPDMVIDSVVIAIYPDGVLVEAYDVQKILIPESSYKDNYSFRDNMLTRDNTTISKGDNLKVRLTAVRYDDHCFSCLGVIA